MISMPNKIVVEEQMDDFIAYFEGNKAIWEVYSQSSKDI